MFQKALAATSRIGPLSNPFTQSVRQSQIKPPAACGSAVSAGLSAEEDFELGGEFLDVFTRANERVAGFVVGCTVVGVVWLAFSLL
jgi:hypothetical protein